MSCHRKLFHKVDKDQDGFVSEKELFDWIVYIQLREVMKNVEEEKKETDFNKDGFIEWDEFVKKTQDFIDKYASMYFGYIFLFLCFVQRL